MDVNGMRDYILRMYPGPAWVEKVAHMRDDQVMAIYFSMKEKGQQPIKEDKRKKKERQLTIFDYDEEGRFYTGR